MGIHDGHRERLRDEFLAVGVKGKSDHQVLEVILSFIIPRVDVNPIAHQLINSFGSLAGVLDASIHDLTKFPYITKRTASFLKLFPIVFPAYHESKFKKRVNLGTASQLKEYMIPKLANEKNEVFYILCLDAHCNLIQAIRHNEGMTTKANLNIQGMVSEVLRTGASTIVLVHNHLSGKVDFSKQDIEATLFIINTFNNLQINVADHFVISGSNCASFTALPPSFI